MSYTMTKNDLIHSFDYTDDLWSQLIVAYCPAFKCHICEARKVCDFLENITVLIRIEISNLKEE